MNKNKGLPFPPLPLPPSPSPAAYPEPPTSLSPPPLPVPQATKFPGATSAASARVALVRLRCLLSHHRPLPRPVYSTAAVAAAPLLPP